MRGSLPVLVRVLEDTLIVAGAAVLTHALWELAQLSLYVLANSNPSPARLGFVVARLRGDVGFSALGFLLACVILRDATWPSRKIRSGVVIMALFGLVFAAAREWLGAHSGSIMYTDGTVQILGVATPPLLQWLIVPVLIARLVAALARKGH